MSQNDMLEIDFAGRLTAAETDHLARCETTIERGLGAFMEVGAALLDVRDNRLYRTDYPTFEAYCAERWGISRPRAYELMTAAEVVSGMPDIDVPAPANARQATELARVPEADRAEVWAETVSRTEGKPTAAAVREVWKGREAEPVERDPWAFDEPVVKPWTADEERLRDEVIAGRTVVASLRGQHANLIDWAEDQGLYVRIDRRTDWGNPFELPADGDRATVIDAYERHYLPHKPSLLSRLGTLRGKVLGCWCAPEACHGDVLKRWAER